MSVYPSSSSLLILLVDTNILVLLSRRGEVGRRLLDRFPLFMMEPAPVVSFVSLAEVRTIAARNKWGRAKINQLDFVLSLFRVVDINEPGILEAYVETDVFSSEHGVEMGKNDLWIAATACAKGMTILTADKDFDHLNPDFLTRIWIDPALGKQTPHGSIASDSIET